MYKDVYSLLLMNGDIKFIINNLLKGIYHYGNKFVLELNENSNSTIIYKTYCHQSLPELIFHFTKMRNDINISSLYIQNEDIVITMVSGASIRIHYQQDKSRINLILTINVKWSEELAGLVRLVKKDIGVDIASIQSYVKYITNDTLKPIYQLTVQQDEFHYLLLFKLKRKYFSIDRLGTYEKKNNSCYIFTKKFDNSPQVYRCSILNDKNEFRIRKYISDFSVKRKELNK